jgi:glucose-6-phosphate-specific signal transduction histidine kinase
VAFFSYRWLAWAVAALALTLPERPVATLPRDAGLLLLIGVINVVATALSQGYVRLARRRPAILGLDLAASAAVLWLSGSTYLPFLPYALAPLVLPALLFGWRGALSAAAIFIGLDLFGLSILNAGAQLGEIALAVRPLTPLAFAGLWAALGQLLLSGSPGYEAYGAQGDLAAPELPGADEAPPGTQPPLRSLERPRSEGVGTGATNLAATSPLVVMRAATEQRSDLSRRVIYDLNPAQDLSLTASLEQLGAGVARQGDLAVSITSTGSPRLLTQAQHSLLLRIAHECLLNVQQHARAHSVLLTLAYESAAVTLVVQDDGVGLLDGTYERPGLHALRAVRYRLAELDGQLAVFESESGGVTVRATLPLDA